MAFRCRLEELEGIQDAVLVTDSTDLDSFRDAYPTQIVRYCEDLRDLTGVVAIPLSGEFLSVWVTCWKRPFDAHSEYTRIF